LNQRPSGYEPDELPDCSTPHQFDQYRAIIGCRQGILFFLLRILNRDIKITAMPWRAQQNMKAFSWILTADG
jgi:hypothetical protein